MEDVIDLESSKEYLEENRVFDEIIQLLTHAQLKNPERLKRRLWLYLNMNIKPRF